MKTSEVMYKLRGSEGEMKAGIIWGKVCTMVEEIVSQKTIYVYCRNSKKHVNPKTDLPRLDISKVPKFYWSQGRKYYISCSTYRKMKEGEICDEIYDEKIYGVATPYDD